VNVRRALHRARQGVSLNLEEATTLLHARGLPFVHQNAPIYLAGKARAGASEQENRAVHALARILLHGRIDNIQTSWVKLGNHGTQLMLTRGANDLGGTLMEETISRMAGADNGSLKTVARLKALAAGLGRPARQRTTTYGDVSEERRRARGCFDRATPRQLRLVAANTQERP
jgi:FO synthase